MDEASIKRYLKDVEYFSKKLEEDPTSRVFMPLAFAYLRLGKYDKVIEVCSKGLDNHPDYHAAKVVLANAFLEKGMLDEAKHLLYDVVEKVPENYRANKMLGDILRESGDIIGATVYYRNALVAAPEDFELKVLIEELTESLGSKAFPRDDELKSMDETIGKVETAPIDEDMSELKSEIGKMGQLISDEEESRSNVVEIPDSIVSATELMEEAQKSSSENVELQFDTLDLGNLEQIEGVSDASKLKDEPIKIDEDLIEKFDFGGEKSDFDVEKHVGLESFDSLTESLPINIEEQKKGDELSIDKKDDKSKILDEPGNLTNDINLDLLDLNVGGTATVESRIDDPLENLFETSEHSISEDEKQLEIMEGAFNLELDKKTDEVGKVSGDEELRTDSKVVEELERWLNNIKKIKEERSV